MTGETRVPRGNPRKHRKNMLRPHRKALPGQGLELQHVLAVSQQWYTLCLRLSQILSLWRNTACSYWTYYTVHIPTPPPLLTKYQVRIKARYIIGQDFSFRFANTIFIQLNSLLSAHLLVRWPGRSAMFQFSKWDYAPWANSASSVHSLDILHSEHEPLIRCWVTQASPSPTCVFKSWNRNVIFIQLKSRFSVHSSVGWTDF